jgi:hypothetical protein
VQSSRLNGYVLIAFGAAIIFGGVALEIAWLIFCFGSVIIGIALLFLAPGILIAPFLAASTIGGGFISSGMELLTNSSN